MRDLGIATAYGLLILAGWLIANFVWDLPQPAELSIFVLATASHFYGQRLRK